MTAPLASPTIPTSWGELVDKITILEIKHARLTDSAALANVARELALLSIAAEAAFATRPGLAEIKGRLVAVNSALWDIEDEIRLCEKRGDFGEAFIALARAVYLRNDERAALKREINMLTGSALVEEKSYAPYS